MTGEPPAVDETSQPPGRFTVPTPGATTLTCSRGLAGWMNTQRCGIGFTTYQTGQLFLVGVTTGGAVSFHQQNFKRAMGIHVKPNRIYVGALYQIWRLENVLRPGQLANEYFDRLYVPRNAQTIGDVDIHEVSVDRSGRLIFRFAGETEPIIVDHVMHLESTVKKLDHIAGNLQVIAETTADDS